MTLSDRRISLLVAFGFALSLGIATVAIPLLAIGAGYDAAAVGFLVAIAAGSQLATRFTLPWLLGRYADRLLIGLAAALMLGGFGLLVASTALPVFVAAMVAQGAARALFWTSSQTHAIRGGGPPVRRLVDLNLAGNVGTLTGPAIGGTLAAIAPQLALAAGGIAVGLALVGTPLLAVFAPYDRRRSAGALRLLRRDGVDVACWANVVGGTWWSMIGSYVPVILVSAGIGPAIIGWLVTLSEGAGATTLLFLRRVSATRIRPIVRFGAFVELGALASIAVAPPLLAVYAVLLIGGGIGAGCVTALSSALATLAAGEHEQGDALALTGVFRATALLAAPAGVGALLAVVALPVAMLSLVAAVVVPGVVIGRAQVAADPAPA